MELTVLIPTQLVQPYPVFRNDLDMIRSLLRDWEGGPEEPAETFALEVLKNYIATTSNPTDSSVCDYLDAQACFFALGNSPIGKGWFCDQVVSILTLWIDELSQSHVPTLPVAAYAAD